MQLFKLFQIVEEVHKSHNKFSLNSLLYHHIWINSYTLSPIHVHLIMDVYFEPEMSWNMLVPVRHIFVKSSFTLFFSAFLFSLIPGEPFLWFTTSFFFFFSSSSLRMTTRAGTWIPPSWIDPEDFSVLVTTDDHQVAFSVRESVDEAPSIVWSSESTPLSTALR